MYAKHAGLASIARQKAVEECGAIVSPQAVTSLMKAR